MMHSMRAIFFFFTVIKTGFLTRLIIFPFYPWKVYYFSMTHDLPGLENEIKNSMTFQVDIQVQTLLIDYR